MITDKNYKMFEIYAREYKNNLLNMNSELLEILEKNMKKINKELAIYIKEICKLDLEFKVNSYTIPDPIMYFVENGKILERFDYINNTCWKGFWRKCSGNDLEYFISYLEYPIIYPNHKNYLKNNKNLEKLFKYETGLIKTPYGVKCAELINKKYFK